MKISKIQLLLLLLFSLNESLFAYAGTSCHSIGKFSRELKSARNLENCNNRSRTIEERLIKNHSFIYLKIPKLDTDYLEYNLEPYRRSEIDLGTYLKKVKMLPIYIEMNGQLLNPLKENVAQYNVSSKIKEQIIFENYINTERSCLFMAHGSEYLFPVPSEKGELQVILYLDSYKDFAQYKALVNNPVGRLTVENTLFEQFIHRGLQMEVNFKPRKVYQIIIELNPLSTLLVGSYNANFWGSGLNDRTTVPGFTITLKELPPNTKFAFDGKDDVGKTYEQVKKEFILYDKDAEADK
ncbi:MAG: hypothetical protein IPO06_03315 [Leptospiraceae bacterium]|nr:hypothetical protein [Leptospiraceae bacterium]MBK9498407.1 hypothetical protein [Leptospiraceae bacterium]